MKYTFTLNDVVHNSAITWHKFHESYPGSIISIHTSHALPTHYTAATALQTVALSAVQSNGVVSLVRTRGAF